MRNRFAQPPELIFRPSTGPKTRISRANSPTRLREEPPYGLVITPDQHVWMADGGYHRIVELDQSGKILGAFGEPGHKPGQMAWAHFLAIGPNQAIYVADVLNWRFQVFARTAPTGNMTKYIPSVRMFWGSVPSVGWASKQADIPFTK